MKTYAIKKLPLNLSGMYKKVENPMSTRHDIGEFEINAESADEARQIASTMVSDSEPNMICEWSEKHGRFIRSHKREFVHPTPFFKFNGRTFTETIEPSKRGQPKSGKFLTKEEAENDYVKHKKVADKKITEALEHLEAIDGLGVSLDYHMDGDTHGIYEDYMYLEIIEGSHIFTHKINH